MIRISELSQHLFVLAFLIRVGTAIIKLIIVDYLIRKRYYVNYSICLVIRFDFVV